MHRSRRNPNPLLAAILVVSAIGVPVWPAPAHAGIPASPQGGSAGVGTDRTATGPVFPRPGGGPRVITSYVSLMANATHLLDPLTGTYPELPYGNLAVSPDGRLVAVEDPSGRLGVAGRLALLRHGAAAVRWTGLVGPPLWSPDGTALLTTTLDKATWRFTAHRYDLRTGLIRSTPIDLPCDSCTAGWAADSVRYTVMLSAAVPDTSGPVRYLNPDGTPGPLLGTEGMIWNEYSPSRRYVVLEPPRPVVDDSPAEWKLPKVFDLLTGRVVSRVETDWPLVGWYDDRRVVRIAPGAPEGPTTLEVVDIHTGAVTGRVVAPGLPVGAVFQVGSSAGLLGDARELGF